MAFIASKAASSSSAATAATGSPMNRTLSRQRACSSWLTGRMPTGIGRSLPVRTATTPGIRAAFEASMRTMRACGSGARWILQKSIRGRTMSSANFTRPAHLASPSTFRTGRPTIRRPRPAARGLVATAIERLLGRAGRRVLHAAGRQLDRLEDLDVAGAAAEITRQRLADLRARRPRPLVEERLRGAEDPGGAVAALRGTELGERLLQRMRRRSLGQPLDRDDRAILALQAEDEA